MLLSTLKLRPQPSTGHENASEGKSVASRSRSENSLTFFACVAIEVDLMIEGMGQDCRSQESNQAPHLQTTGPVEALATVVTLVFGNWLRVGELHALARVAE